MDMSYGAAFLEEAPDAYERLLLDAMVGDPTLFIRSDEVDQAWQIVDPILERLGRTGRCRWPATRPGRGDPARPTSSSSGTGASGGRRSGRHLGRPGRPPERRGRAPSPTCATSRSSTNAARTAVMTLVAVVPGDEQAYAATRALRALGRPPPGPDRAPAPRPRPGGHPRRPGRPVRRRRRRPPGQLRGGHPVRRAARRPTTSTRWSRPSPCPTCRCAVWYVGAVPEPTDPLLSVATAVLIDSRDAAGTGRLRDLLELARRRTVVDLSWIRLQPVAGAAGRAVRAGRSPAVAGSRSSRSRSAARSVPASCSAAGWPAQLRLAPRPGRT